MIECLLTIKRFILLILITYFVLPNAHGATRTVDLVVGYKTICVAGKPRQAILVNNQLPGPTLRFTEGDHVTINVHNHLDKPTAIHWHGLLVPWQVDGVENITQKGIPPGGVFKYKFTLMQSGTYWYHSHAGIQEQRGLYGSIIIDPLKPPAYQYDKDFVVVLSDWSNTLPKNLYANLKKNGDYYSPLFPIQPSLQRFICDYKKANKCERKKLVMTYKMMQKTRMSFYDFSDIAYDAYLLNGKPPSNPWRGQVSLGDTVRLRFIGAGASTIFKVKIPGTQMQMVHIDGNDVEPYPVDSFKIAPGETYDVLVKILKSDPYLIYAESIDTFGAAMGGLVTSPNQKIACAHVKPFAQPKPVKKAKGPQARIGKYTKIKAAVKTNNPNKPIYRTIHMDLEGYMDRYMWFINGKPDFNSGPIMLVPGKRYRIVFHNNTMMQHPMHIHGHWFIVRNGYGEYDPLLHTLNIAPGEIIVADIDADASGQWFFHCHHLYHMVAGMARVFQYTTLLEVAEGKRAPENTVYKLPYTNQAVVRVDKTMPIITSLIKHPVAHPPKRYLASFLDVNEDPFHNTQQVTFKGLFGKDCNKLQVYMNEAQITKGKIEELCVDFFYWRLLSQFWAIKGGVNYVYRPAKTPYLQPGIGIEGLTPYFIDTDLRVYYHKGSFKADLELSRDTQICNNFFISTGARAILATKTLPEDEIGSGLNEIELTVRPFWRLNPIVNIYCQYQYTSQHAALKRLMQRSNQATTEKLYSIGISFLL